MSSGKRQGKLSTTAKYVIYLCKMIIKDVKSGECTDEEINDIVTSAEIRREGYINPDDYIKSDKALEYLGVNRVEFFKLIRKHRVKCNRLNNMPIGYYKRDLGKIRCSLRKS